MNLSTPETKAVKNLLPTIAYHVKRNEHRAAGALISLAEEHLKRLRKRLNPVPWDSDKAIHNCHDGAHAEHDEVMRAIGHLPEGDGGEHAEIMREIGH